MNNNDPPRVKTFKRRRKPSSDARPILSAQPNVTPKPSPQRPTPSNVATQVESSSPPPRRNSTEELLALLNQTDGVLSLDDKEEYIMPPSSSSLKEDFSPPPPSSLLSKNDQSLSSISRSSTPTTTTTAYRPKKDSTFIWIIILFLIVGMIYIIYTRQLTPTVSSTLDLNTDYPLGDRMSDGIVMIKNCIKQFNDKLWVIQDWIEKCKQSSDTYLRYFVHWIEECRLMMEHRLDQVIMDMTTMILNYRHQLANWIDPYPRCETIH
ncbi:hypothetical protein BDA99DRAFT_564013 [Phascolomyces articulosus]|uniref:Uncharacterized protein n=1 Tax=Phascolomyces articulosus TaxID=60185 RepID=A0AAD5K1A1_9FUNG|nr:hypothetical protein BDA99DRAFT_564013 [Phascolomyces articulosus]